MLRSVPFKFERSSWGDGSWDMKTTDGSFFFSSKVYGWAALGDLFNGASTSFLWRWSKTTPFSLCTFWLLARSRRDVVRRCRCCCADKTRVCHAAGAFFLYPSGEHRLGIFLFRTSNIEYIFSLRIETPHLLHILCPDYLVVPCLVFATTMLTPFPHAKENANPGMDVSKYSQCLFK